MTSAIWWGIFGFGLVVLLGRRVWLRLQLSRAKHRSLAGHARWSRRLARLVPFYEYDEEQFFRADDAPEHIGEQRRAAFARLAASIENGSLALCGRPTKFRTRSRIYNSLRAIACRFSSAAWSASI